MRNHQLGPLWLIVLLLWFFAQPGFAEEPDGGKALYVKYCAACHGADGRGKGPVSVQLNFAVPDLTALKRENRGIFPLARVMSAVDGTREVKGHGSSTMPVWGEIFVKEAEARKYPTLTALLKVKIIAEYLSALQR